MASNVFAIYSKSNIQNFFLFLHISFAIHCNVRNWHQFFFMTDLVRAKSKFLVYRLHGNIDYLENTIQPNLIVSQKLVKLSYQSDQGKIGKTPIEMLSMIKEDCSEPRRIGQCNSVSPILEFHDVLWKPSKCIFLINV